MDVILGAGERLPRNRVVAKGPGGARGLKRLPGTGRRHPRP
ncbi:MAG: oxidase [Gammaproteobacteria bacterium]|nr:MAG: oxidase [Gammaproteobacteria bacterium]